MSYRRTKKYTAQRLAAMKAGRDMARLAKPAPDYLAPLPDLRMRITVERFDFGHESHVFELRRTSRVDVYSVTVDGQPWQRCGLSGVLEGLRKACPRVLGPRAAA
jgi:hypothetical protein